jgi:hypothetical protein
MGLSIDWWWVPSLGGSCHDCGEQIPKGWKVAYRATDRYVLCEFCTNERWNLDPVESKRWVNRKKAKKTYRAHRAHRRKLARSLPRPHPRWPEWTEINRGGRAVFVKTDSLA